MTQQFLLPCSCGQKIRVGIAQAGEQVACVCGNRLAVPTMRGIRQLEAAPAEKPAKSAPRWSRVHGAIFATGLLAAAVGLVIIAMYGLRYAQAAGFGVDRTDETIQAEAARIDKLSPIQALAEWTDTVKEGIGPRETPPWVAVKGLLTTYRYWMTIGGITLAAGLGLAIGSLFVGRGVGVDRQRGG
jgi:hypothetical protein